MNAAKLSQCSYRDTEHLLNDLEHPGQSFFARAGKLVVRPREAIIPEVRSQIREHESDLFHLVKHRTQPR